jgi:hypothetical protein
MQEPFGMAEGMRLPFFAIIQQRGGPSSGTVIYSQQKFLLLVMVGMEKGTGLFIPLQLIKSFMIIRLKDLIRPGNIDFQLTY